MFFKKIKQIFTDKGFLLCLVLSITILIIFFGKLLLHPNTTFFGTSGDAILVYYNSLYHTLHNKELLTESAMFYPYSESIFFTSCMPILTQFIKLFFLENYTIGIINLFMLLSMPIGAVFLYLIFKEYKVNVLFAVFSAVAIAYLSPQIHRLTGHYNLSYVFAIPATIWLMIKYIKAPSYKKSILIGLYCFFLATMHMYLFIFAVAIITFGWISALFTKTFIHSVKQYILNYAIQIILPFLVLQLLIYVVNTSDVRTNSPWGFFDYYSNMNGIFYSKNEVYQPLFKLLQLDGNVSYEGVAFVGIAALFFCMTLILKSVFNLLTLKPLAIFNPTGDKFLNFLLLTSLICLMFSFCIPFRYGYENLLDYLGFLKQFRALGRFTWLFFYVINICLIVCVSNISQQYNKFYLKPVLMVLVVCFMSYDAFCNINGFQNQINYSYPEWTDTKNQDAKNAWVKEIEIDKYQAILPFPYFQVGSENLGTKVVEQSVINACLVSIKTGLPMISVLGSRLPLERAHNNLQLLTEPTGKTPVIFNDFKNDKDILIVSVDDLCNHYEWNIVRDAKLIHRFERFSLYRISLKDLKAHYPKYSKENYEDFKTKKLYHFGDYQTTDSVQNFISVDFKKLNNDMGCFDKGVMKGKGYDYTVILETPLPPKSPDSLYTLSFWVKNMKQDLVSRAGFEIIAKTVNADIYSILYSNIGNYYYQINNDWTLLEYEFKAKNPTDTIKVTLWNPSMRDQELLIDNVLLRPSKNRVYFDKSDYLLKNNRIFYKQ